MSVDCKFSFYQGPITYPAVLQRKLSTLTLLWLSGRAVRDEVGAEQWDRRLSGDGLCVSLLLPAADIKESTWFAISETLASVF
jgi:hypothetical protein